jgi:DNA modification methylase
LEPLEILRVPLDAIIPDPANPRLHDERNLAAISASLQRFGQAEPIVTQAGTRRIIAGHGRLEAMRALGWNEADIVELPLDDTQAAALGIAMNRTGELASWDDNALTTILRSLEAQGALDATGFTADELDTLLKELEAENAPAGVDDPGPTEPPEVPITQRGDLWLLGDHRLLCGDSTSAEDVTRLMNGEKAVLWSSDPPYAVSYTGNDRPLHNGKPSGKDWSHLYRETDIKDLGEFLNGIMAATLPHVADHSPVYMWHAHVQQPTIAAVFERHGLLLHQVLVWVKPSAVFGHSYFRWRHEPCAFGWRQGSKPQHGVGQLDTVWEADWDGKARFSTFHPTSKPTRLFEIPLELHTKPGDVVIEPFNGSGSQIIAASKLARRCYAMELQPAFIDGTIDRWQTATNKVATLEATGQTFTEVQKERADA